MHYLWYQRDPYGLFCMVGIIKNSWCLVHYRSRSGTAGWRHWNSSTCVREFEAHMAHTHVANTPMHTHTLFVLLHTNTHTHTYTSNTHAHTKKMHIMWISNDVALVLRVILTLRNLFHFRRHSRKKIMVIKWLRLNLTLNFFMPIKNSL